MDFHIGTNRCNEMVQSAKENPCESRPAKIYLARPIQKSLRLPRILYPKSPDILPELNCALAVFIMLYNEPAISTRKTSQPIPSQKRIIFLSSSSFALGPCESIGCCHFFAGSGL